MTDFLTLTGIRAYGCHGVLDFEKTQAQEFVVDARIEMDLSAAGASDDLADTVDYGQIAQMIVNVVGGKHCDLIEALAQRIAEAVLQRSPVRRVVVTVHKPSAPLRVPFGDVAVTIERSRIAQDTLSDMVGSESGGASGIDSAPSSGMSGDSAGGSSADDESADSATTSPLHTAVLSLGGNLGDPAKAMLQAIVAIDSLPGTQVCGISPLYQTTPWGMGSDAPDFLNAIIQLTTTMSGTELLRATQAIEAAHGRVRTQHWGSRTLDIDIIDFDGLVSSDPQLTLPHPRAWQRAFVLAPWLALDPDAAIVGPHGGTVTDLLAACPDKDSVRRISDTWILGGDAYFGAGPQEGGRQ